jgi:ATP-dependent RNA helicase DDX42
MSRVVFTLKKGGAGASGGSGLLGGSSSSRAAPTAAHAPSSAHTGPSSSTSSAPAFEDSDGHIRPSPASHLADPPTSSPHSSAEGATDDPLDSFMSGVIADLEQERRVPAHSGSGAGSGSSPHSSFRRGRGEVFEEEESGAGFDKKLDANAPQQQKRRRGRAGEGGGDYMEEDEDEEVDDDEDDSDDGDDADGAGGSGRKRKRERDEDLVDSLPAVDHAAMQYKPFLRCFYAPVADVAAMSAAQVSAARKELDLVVDGISLVSSSSSSSSASSSSSHEPPDLAPVRSFMHLGLDTTHPALIGALARAGFEAPTPIQSQSLPILLSGRDLIGIAKTGSGKTLAYALPLIRHVSAQRPGSGKESDGGPVGLVLAPTRELATQIYDVARKFGRVIGLSAVLATGGASKWEQTKALHAGCDIVIGTPGRVLDHVRSGALPLACVSFLVLDEADRMLDMGFAQQVYALLARVRPDRQAAMFSATFARRIEMLAREALSDPVRIVVGSAGQASEDVTQEFRLLPVPEAKMNFLLTNLPTWAANGKVIVFVSGKADADTVASALNAAPSLAWLRGGGGGGGGGGAGAGAGAGATTSSSSASSSSSTFVPGVPVVAASLHGDKHQAERDAVLSAFRKGVVRVLVATDVASRGLDVPSVATVLNFDVPRAVETYVHRVGRTGRIGSGGEVVEGRAITLLTHRDAGFAAALVRHMQMGGSGSGNAPQELLELARRNPKFRDWAPVRGSGAGAAHHVIAPPGHAASAIATPGLGAAHESVALAVARAQAHAASAGLARFLPASSASAATAASSGPIGAGAGFETARASGAAPSAPAAADGSSPVAPAPGPGPAKKRSRWADAEATTA